MVHGPGIVVRGAVMVTAASAVRLIIGAINEIDAGVIAIELNPMHTLSVIPVIAWTV